MVYQQKLCSNCNRTFTPRSSRSLYCDMCRYIVRSRKAAFREQVMRLDPVYRNNRNIQERSHYRDNKEKRLRHIDFVLRWRNKNQEVWLQYKRAYDRVRMHRQRALGDLTIDDVRLVFEECNHTCVYCNRQDNLTIDHIIPVSRGGTNHLYNLVVACRSCNSMKGSKPLLNFLFYREYVGV